MRTTSAANGERVPVLLFGDGRACFDISLATQPETAAMHRTQKPHAWSEWRTTASGAIQILDGGAWKSPAINGMFPAQAANTTLGGRFKRLDGLSVGVTAISTEKYRFWDDGTFRSCTRLQVTGSGAPSTRGTDRVGTYGIEGYTLTLRDRDGTIEKLPFVYDETLSSNAWIGPSTFQSDNGDPDREISFFEFLNEEIGGKDVSPCAQ